MLRLALLVSLTIFTAGHGSAHATVGVSDPGPGDETLRSPRYAVTAAGQPSFVYQTANRPAGTGPLKEVLLETMAWTTLASDQSVVVDITFLGRASDITIRQVTAEGPFAKPSEITGTPGHPIERITLENIRLGGRPITSLEQIPLNTNPQAFEITVRSSS